MLTSSSAVQPHIASKLIADESLEQYGQEIGDEIRRTLAQLARHLSVLDTASDHNADMNASGVLIAESLSKDSPLDGVDLHVRKISRVDVGDVSAGQPLTWTFIEFEVDDQVVTDLAEALSLSISASGGWYCDFRTDDETFVVFAGRVFRYPRGQAEGRAEAETYGRVVGVPEVQLDWPE